MSSEKYLLDADAFIRSKREHYAFDIVPGYWEAILKAHELRRVASIIPVRKELRRGNDDLAQWVKDNTPEAFLKRLKTKLFNMSFARSMRGSWPTRNMKSPPNNDLSAVPIPG